MLQKYALVAILLVFFTAVQGQQPKRDQRFSGRHPEVRPIKSSNGDIKLEQITFHQKLKEVSFPAEYIIGQEDTKEFLITSQEEFAHETLFFTDSHPYHIQFMLILLGADNTITREGENRRGSIIDIDVEFKSKGRTIRRNIESWLMEDGKHCKRRGFYFLGSRIHNKYFQAQGNGKIASLWHQDDAILDIIHPENDRADIFTLNKRTMGLIKYSKVRIILYLRKE